jgi:hypothetical protein
MRLKQFARFAAAILLVSGCQTMNAAADVPALLSEPDEASRAALRDTISAIFGGQDVPLADDALTKSSLLLIERNPRGSLDAPPATGRVLEEPIRFRLVKSSGGECVLVDLRDESRHLLPDTTCVPE